MDIYLVGGSVRDRLLGIESQDRDWLVIGANAQALLDRGFEQVGADFPVFLHPETHEEYALGRIERKTGQGYLGFEVQTQDVTLEEDLSRRDLTINAMALSDQGVLFDPFGGAADLAKKSLRHVSPAFAEDPVRVLRLFRFMARFGPAWSIHPLTDDLIAQMIDEGELNHLGAERIWKESSRALMEPHAVLYVQELYVWELTRLPAFEAYRAANTSPLVSKALEDDNLGLCERFAVAFTKGASADVHAYPGVPKDCARMACLWGMAFANPGWLADPQENAVTLHAFLGRAEAYKGSTEVRSIIAIWRAMGEDTRRFEAAVDRALQVDTKAISCSMKPGPEVGAAIGLARVKALRHDCVLDAHSV